jgi:hypothetical protein
MKRLLLGVALVAAVAACKAQTNKSVSSAEGATVNSCATKTGCSTEAKAGCSMEAKKECDSTKVCPATGKTMN